MTNNRDVAYAPLLGAEKTDDEEVGAVKDKDSDELALLRELYKEKPRKGNNPDGGERGCGSMVRLLGAYLYFQGSKVMNIWFWQCLFFYVDVFLDISVFRVFYKHGDYHFIACSAIGIVLSTLYSLVEMMRGVQPTDPPWLMMLLGFLLPLQGHVLALCIYSTVALKGPHPMLLSFKLAESALEATVSSVVQTYSSIFRHLNKHDQIVTYLSVSSSYLSIAYAFTVFDHRKKGLHHLPGLRESWDFRLLTVFLFRICEVTSRIVSLGLLQRSTRNELVYGVSLETYAGVAVIAFDFVIMFTLICIYQCPRSGGSWKNIQFSIISVIAYINPLLLKENAFTIPCWLYYLVRAVELGGMGLMSYKLEKLHCPRELRNWHDEGISLQQRERPSPLCTQFPNGEFKGLEAYKGEFWDDEIPVMAFFASTALMFLILPFIRCLMADNILLKDKQMYITHKFGDTEDHLCGELLRGRGTLSIKTLDTTEAEDSKRFRLLVKGVLDDACKALTKSINASGGVHNRMSRQESFHASNNMALGKEDAKVTFQPLEDWLDREYWEREEALSMKLSVAERFEQMVRVSWNIRKWLKIDDDFKLFYQDGDKQGDKLAVTEKQQRERHRKCLKVINTALVSPDVKERLLRPEVGDMLLEMLPDFEEWTSDDNEVLEQEMLLYREKCELIGKILQKGWERDQDFRPLAKKLHRQVVIKQQVLEGDGFNKEGLKGENPKDYKFVVRVQLWAFIQMLMPIPPHQFKRSIISDQAEGLFRRDIEFKQCVAALDAVIEHRKEPTIGTLEAKMAKSREEWVEMLELVGGAFDPESDSMIYNPDWEKQLDTARALQMLPPVMSTLRLEKVSFHKEDGVPTEFEVKKSDEVVAHIGTAKEEWRTQGFKLKLHFVRVAEVEKDRPLDELKEWHVTETLILLFFRVMNKEIYNESVLELISDADLSDESAKAAKEAVIKHQKTFEQEVVNTLDHNKESLKGRAEKFVNPFTSEDKYIRSFQSKFLQKQGTNDSLVTSVEVMESVESNSNSKGVEAVPTVSVAEIKTRTQSNLSGYEKQHEHMMEYFKKVKQAFDWSAAVSSFVDKCEVELGDTLSNLRADLLKYWQEVEMKNTARAQKKEERAVRQERQAVEKATEAKQQEEAAKKREEEAKKKEKDAQESAEKATKAMEKAKKDEEAALEKEKKAREKEEQATQKAADAKKKEEDAKQREQAATVREKEALEKEKQAQERAHEAEAKEERARQAKEKIEKEIQATKAASKKDLDEANKKHKKELEDAKKEAKKQQDNLQKELDKVKQDLAKEKEKVKAAEKAAAPK